MADQPRVQLSMDEAHGSSYMVVECSCRDWQITGVGWDWDELRGLVIGHLAQHQEGSRG